MKNIARIPALIILSCAMIFGCGKSEPPKKAPDEVKLQLKWTHQAQFAGFYMANEKGYYAKENIKITFLEGGQDAIENNKEAVAVTLKYAHFKDSDTQTAIMEALLPLVHTGEDQIGWMKPMIWHDMYGTLLGQGLLEKPFDVNQAYTTRFIKEIYGGKAE